MSDLHQPFFLEHYEEGRLIARKWFEDALPRLEQYHQLHLSKFEGRTDFNGDRQARFASWEQGFGWGLVEVLHEISGGHHES